MWKDAQYRSLLEKCKSKLQWDITSHQSEWPSSKSLQTINAEEDMHCWWERKLIQPLWTTVCRFLKKLGIKPPYDPASLVASLVAQTVKRLPIMWETWVWSLGWEDPLEKEMAAHSSTLAWKIPWAEEPGGLQSMESQRVGHDWATSLSLSFMTQQSQS